jgi:hypothetical protein
VGRPFSPFAVWFPGELIAERAPANHVVDGEADHGDGPGAGPGGWEQRVGRRLPRWAFRTHPGCCGASPSLGWLAQRGSPLHFPSPLSVQGLAIVTGVLLPPFEYEDMRRAWPSASAGRWSRLRGPPDGFRAGLRPARTGPSDARTVNRIGDEGCARPSPRDWCSCAGSPTAQRGCPASTADDPESQARAGRFCRRSAQLICTQPHEPVSP